MKTVILAGGFGTRLSEETGVRPKPLVEIGGRPILWHIMKMYSYYGFHDFVICCGYKGYMIKEFFANYYLHTSDVTFDLMNNTRKTFNKNLEPWKITLIDTGEDTMTGGRILKIKEYIDNKPFFLTYGDGVCDLNFKKLLEFHQRQKTFATLTAVQPEGRYGAFSLEPGQERIKNFREKPIGNGSESTWINGGFFVLEPQIFDYIGGEQTVWEREPMENLAATSNLSAYKHDGYWQCMDSLRDKNLLEEQWQCGKAPWKNW